jgi:hypothetical protein
LQTVDCATGACRRLQKSEENVKTRLRRARALLRDELFALTGADAPSAFQFHLFPL